jgi:glycosyltransferase involved in cell wall biosynthesis
MRPVAGATSHEDGKPPLSVLFVVHSPQRRGAEVSARQVADALAERGYRTRLVALYGAAAGHELPMGDDDVALGGEPRHRAERLPGIHPRLLHRLRREIRRFAPDVVQVNGSRTVKYGAAAALASPRRRWALVYRNIGDPDAWQTAGWRRAIYRRLVMARMDGVVSGSARNLERVIATYGLSVPAAAIPRGVDPRQLAPRRERAAVRREEATAADRPVLIYLGSLTAEKRVDRLVDVVARLGGEAGGGPVLWVVGDGPLRGELSERAAAAGVGGRVRFLGVRHDVGDLLAAADLLVLASDTEGTPGVVLEAAALGVPAVATRVGGTAECVVEGETALLVEPHDVEALAAAVGGLLAAPERRRAMGERARRWVDERFLLADLAPRYEAFYRQVLRRRGGTSEGTG